MCLQQRTESRGRLESAVAALHLSAGEVDIKPADSIGPLWPPEPCNDRLLVASPVPARVSADPGGGRHAEPRHPVERIAPDFRLGLLIGQSSGLKFPADDDLVAKHRCFNQTPAVVT